MFYNFKTTLSAVALSSAIFLAAAAPAQAGPATDFIKKTSTEVSSLLQQKDSKKRQEAFSTKLNATVDFRELASRALGEHWTKQPAEEQQKFLDLLQLLLESNYREKLSGQTLGEDYKIEYVDERTRDNLAIVETRIKWEEHAKPVGYKLLEKDGEWVIYDIVIDDISLVETYRDAYTEIIETEGWDSLISRMEKKAAQLQKAKPAKSSASAPATK